LGKKINKNCPCTIDCIRHGKCSECRAFHKKNGGTPACKKVRMTKKIKAGEKI